MSEDIVTQTENIYNLISELPLTKYLKENYGMTPKNWAFWSAGSINKGRLNFSSDGDLGIINRTEGFILGADVNYNKGSLFGIALRHEDDKTNIIIPVENVTLAVNRRIP